MKRLLIVLMLTVSAGFCGEYFVCDRCGEMNSDKKSYSASVSVFETDLHLVPETENDWHWTYCKSCAKILKKYIKNFNKMQKRK